MWGSGGGPRTQRRHASGQGRQARFGPSHSQVLPTCLGLICRFRERVRRSGRVGTRKRREGRAPNTGAARGWEQEGPGGQSSQERFWPSGAMLPQTLPLQPCAGLGAQADQTSRSPGQSGRRELRAMGWQEESRPQGLGKDPVSAVPSTGGDLTNDSDGEGHALASDARARFPPTPTMPLLLQSQPCPVHCGRKPRPGGRSPSRARPAGRPGCGRLGRGRVWAQRHGGGWSGGSGRWHRGFLFLPGKPGAVARKPPPTAHWEALASPRPREVRTPAQP